jgi:hypothetical protein
VPRLREAFGMRKPRAGLQEAQTRRESVADRS